MPLSAGHPTLKSTIETAYYNARDDGANGIDTIPQLSKDVGNAIHVYMETADVLTDIITPGGQTAVAPAHSPAVYASSANPGGTGTGTISFLGGDVSTLIGDIETAYYNARDDGANGIDIIPSLSLDMKTAIHKFALTAKVETSVTVFPGQTVSPYVNASSGVTIPATSQTGTGKGEGSLS
jgi:hypothetical protein